MLYGKNFSKFDNFDFILIVILNKERVNYFSSSSFDKARKTKETGLLSFWLCLIGLLVVLYLDTLTS